MARIRGAEKHLRRLQAARDAARTVDAGIYLAAETIRAEAQYLIVQGSISGSGHIPSARGQPPNADTRQLDQSIFAEKTGFARAKVEVGAPYGVFLQFGTSSMKPRPFMDVAVDNKKREILENLGVRVRYTLRRPW